MWRRYKADGLPASYDAWKLSPPVKHFAGRCLTCGAEYESDSRPQADEDGMPDYGVATQPCVGCGVELCEACGQHRCEYCGALLCPACAISEPEYPGSFCRACHQALRAECAAEEAAEKEVTE